MMLCRLLIMPGVEHEVQIIRVNLCLLKFVLDNCLMICLIIVCLIVGIVYLTN